MNLEIESLELEGLGFGYARDAQVLRDISVSFPSGQFACLLGESGCGKSTLLRLVAGLLQPTKGRLTKSATARIGFVFQDSALMGWRSVAGNVALPLRVAGVSQAEMSARVSESLSLVGLADYAEALPRTLSGGMKMRVSLARALAQRPDILLMDEPFGALDEITRDRLNDDLLEIWQMRRPTILFVTHSISECAYLGERVLVMGDGRICDDLCDDTPRSAGDDFRQSDIFRARIERLSVALREATR